jgi:hypothetical protein
MDIVGWDADGQIFRYSSTPIDLPVHSTGFRRVDARQSVMGGNTVTLVAVGEIQEQPAPSPFEHFTGSGWADTVQIDPLPVVRVVDGNSLVGPGETTPVDILFFDAGTSQVVDSGTSLTAAGIGSVWYENVEAVEPFNAAPRIIDNDDPGYSQDGPLGRSRCEGFLGDERFSNTGTGQNVARWTFAGVTPGWYHVAATWVPGPDRATNAQFRVLDGAAAADAYLWDNPHGALATAAGVAPIDQQAPPTDFVESGAAWQELSDAAVTDKTLYFRVQTHTLTVELPDTGNAYVMADAVRIERLNGIDPPASGVAPEPEMRVLSEPDRRHLTGGFGVENFGTTDERAAVVRRSGSDTADGR